MKKIYTKHQEKEVLFACCYESRTQNRHPRCTQAGTVRWREKSSGNNERNRGCDAVGRGNQEGDRRTLARWEMMHTA
jgi:hypothetical protein